MTPLIIGLQQCCSIANGHFAKGIEQPICLTGTDILGIRNYMKVPFEEALAEYNYEPPVSITLIHKNIFPWTDCNTIIVTIVRECWDEEPINVPYI